MYEYVSNMLVIGVSKSYSNGAKRRNSKTKTCYRKLYFYDEAGNFHCKRISRLKAYWIKLFVKKYKVKTCFTCKQKYLNSCPNC